METILTNLTVSMSDFKKNPAKVLREAGTQPVAVLNHNKPSFYMVDPVLFEAIMEDLADARIAPLIRERQKQRAQAIEVDIDDL